MTRDGIEIRHCLYCVASGKGYVEMKSRIFRWPPFKGEDRYLGHGLWLSGVCQDCTFWTCSDCGWEETVTIDEFAVTE